MLYGVRLAAAPIAVDWAAAEAIPIEAGELETKGREGARYQLIPGGLGDAKQLEGWKQSFARWLRQSRPLRIHYSPTLKRSSNADESERDFRIRLQDSASAQRDIAVERLRKKYAPKKAALEERVRRAQSIVAREREQASGQKLEAAVFARPYSTLGCGARCRHDFTMARRYAAGRVASRAATSCARKRPSRRSSRSWATSIPSVSASSRRSARASMRRARPSRRS